MNIHGHGQMRSPGQLETAKICKTDAAEKEMVNVELKVERENVSRLVGQYQAAYAASLGYIPLLSLNS